MIYYIHSTAHMSQHNTSSCEYFLTELTVLAELAELTELTVTIVLTENLKWYELIICNNLKAKNSN